MSIAKSIMAAAFFFLAVIAASAQEYTYPNELKGYGLFKHGNWKSLKPFVSTKEDVVKIFGQSCEKGCDYDQNWRMQVVYIGQCSSYSESEKKFVSRVSEDLLGKYSNIIFYPKKRIRRNSLKFSKKFSSSEQLTTHAIPSHTKHYWDSEGLIYTFSAGNTYNGEFRKNDLMNIMYSWTDSEYEKYKSKADCPGSGSSEALRLEKPMVCEPKPWLLS